MRESGQTVVEWLVALAGVVALAATPAVATPSVAPAVTGGMQTEICRVTGGSCDGGHAEPAPSAPPAQPQPAASTPRDFCGSSYFNAPELWFTSACEGHDRCYGAHRGKAACDTAFLNDMLATCAAMGSPRGVAAGAHTVWRSCSTSTRRRILPAGVLGIAAAKRTARMRL